MECEQKEQDRLEVGEAALAGEGALEEAEPRLEVLRALVI